MKKRSWRQFLPHLFLWLHVINIVSFYLILWRRTAPDKKDRVQELPPKEAASSSSAPSPCVPRVSMIVPARNEERNIHRCITSLLEQDYDDYEVIVVDDGSTDGTADILDELVASHPQGQRLYVLRLRDELPQGWAGKPHAIHMGVQEAQGEWLLFTDADTWHAPNTLRSALQQAIQEGVDLFTIGSQQELPTFWDKVLMPMAFLGVGMLYPPRLVNNPLSPVAVANGQFILIRRRVYDLVGGYARPDLRGTLLDDRDLARVVKETGFKLHFVDGRGLVHAHMYHGFSDIWRGWRKNAYLGNRGGLPFVLLQLIGLPMISISPFLLPLIVRLTKKWHMHRIGAAETYTASGLELAALFAYRSWLNRQMNVPWYYSLTHPLAGAIFDAILAQSAWRIVTHKGVDWRGRLYHDRKSVRAGEKVAHRV